MSLNGAFESLISEQYSLLILTVGCVAVDIVDCAENRHKVFDSLTRDTYGKRVTGHLAQKTFRTSLLAQVLDRSHNS